MFSNLCTLDCDDCSHNAGIDRVYGKERLTVANESVWIDTVIRMKAVMMKAVMVMKHTRQIHSQIAVIVM